MPLSQDMLRQVAREHCDEARAFAKVSFVPRDGFNEARKQLLRPWVKVVLGVRRCGKSVFCHQLLKGHVYGYLNFDDERLIGLKAVDLNLLFQLVLETTPDAKFLLFDEIQNVDGWELFVNRLHRRGYNLVITGSNSKLLGKELATHLTGRHVTIALHPFSFREFLRARNFNWNPADFDRTEQRAGLMRYFTEYFKSGGFPEMVTGSFDPHYLRELYDKIISRDIVGRYGVKYGRTLKEIALYTFTNFGNRITFHKIKNCFELLSVHTVKNYMQYLQDAYLISLVPAFSFKVKEQDKQARKLYTTDNGMSRAMSPKFNDDRGAGLENMVHQELSRRNMECYYFMADDLEVDFAIKTGREVTELLQVCLTVREPAVWNRESKALDKATKLTGCKTLRILTWDEHDKQRIGKRDVLIEPVWRWMLGTNPHKERHG